MQGSEQWHANNINGQVVHTKPPYPGVGRCSAKLYPCSVPVSAGAVSMNPVVVPGRDAALMEFEEGSVDFLPVRTPIPFSVAYPFVQLASSLEESYVPDSPLGEGNEADVEPSHAGACEVVPPLVVWEELFVASEAYFAADDCLPMRVSEVATSKDAPLSASFPQNGVCSSNDAAAGSVAVWSEGVEVSGVAVEDSHQSGESCEGDVVEEAIVGFVSFVFLMGGGCVVVLGVLTVLGIVFGWR